MLKYATAQVMSKVLIPQDAGRRELKRLAHKHHFDYEVRPGYLYVRCRAISSRCNDNFDEFPADELAKSYRSFVGKPVFVNHVNHDLNRARGVIIDAALHKDANRDGSRDWWVELLQEVDAVRFPRLAAEILNGNIARTSMGCDVSYSICSACNNKATTPAEYCKHIPGSKGQRLYRTTASGQKVGELIRETCYGLKFFENSLLVEPPADPTAFFLGVDSRGLDKSASLKPVTAAPTYNPTDFPPNAPHNAVGYQPHNGEYKVSCDRGCIDTKGYSGHWGQHGAAGLLIRHQDKNGTQRYLMQQRNFHMQHGGTWSVPGGGANADEVGNPKRTAFREAKEEMGRNIPELRVSHTHHDDHGGWGYHTVVADAHRPFAPSSSSSEHLGSGWFTADEIDKLNLHPGFKDSWDQVKQTMGDNPWRSPYGHQGSKLAYGETKAPQDVDTLREDACAVCGDRDTYDGTTCQVCGYVAPPKMFQDPDLELARQMDLRKDVAEFNGQPGEPVDPNTLDENGNPIPGAQDPNASQQPGSLPGEVQAEVQPSNEDPMDPAALDGNGNPIPDEMGEPVDPSLLGPDGQPMPQGQQMTAPDGTPLNPQQGQPMLGPDGMPIGPQDLPASAISGDGKPFNPGPNEPQGPGEPDGPEGPGSPEDLDDDGQPLNPDAGHGAPGTPGDGVPDLMCPECGFTADATAPVSIDMDTANLPSTGEVGQDGVQAGDICPNCGQGLLMTSSEMQGQTPAPVPV